MSRAFNDAKVPYAIGGANALNVWAEPRATMDVDVNVFVTLPELPVIGMSFDLRWNHLTIQLVPILKQLGAITVEEDGDYIYFDESFVESHFIPEGLSYATVYIQGVKVW